MYENRVWKMTGRSRLPLPYTRIQSAAARGKVEATLCRCCGNFWLYGSILMENYVSMCMCAHGGHSTASAIVPQQLTTLFFLRQSLSLAWCLTNRLDCLEPRGSLFSPPLCCSHHYTSPQHSAVCCCCYKSARKTKPRVLHLQSKKLTNWATSLVSGSAVFNTKM